MPRHLSSLMSILLLVLTAQPTLAWPFLHFFLPHLQRLMGHSTVIVPREDTLQMMSNDKIQGGWDRHCGWCSEDTFKVPQPAENYTTHCQLVVWRPIDNEFPDDEWIEVSVLSHDFKELRGVAMPVDWGKETDVRIRLPDSHTPTVGKITVRNGRPRAKGRKGDSTSASAGTNQQTRDNEGSTSKPKSPSYNSTVPQSISSSPTLPSHTSNSTSTTTTSSPVQSSAEIPTPTSRTTPTSTPTTSLTSTPTTATSSNAVVTRRDAKSVTVQSVSAYVTYTVYQSVDTCGHVTSAYSTGSGAVVVVQPAPTTVISMTTIATMIAKRMDTREAGRFGGAEEPTIHARQMTTASATDETDTTTTITFVNTQFIDTSYCGRKAGVPITGDGADETATVTVQKTRSTVMDSCPSTAGSTQENSNTTEATSVITTVTITIHVTQPVTDHITEDVTNTITSRITKDVTIQMTTYDQTVTRLTKNQRRATAEKAAVATKGLAAHSSNHADKRAERSAVTAVIITAYVTDHVTNYATDYATTNITSYVTDYVTHTSWVHVTDTVWRTASRITRKGKRDTEPTESGMDPARPSVTTAGGRANAHPRQMATSAPEASATVTVDDTVWVTGYICGGTTEWFSPAGDRTATVSNDRQHGHGTNDHSKETATVTVTHGDSDGSNEHHDSNSESDDSDYDSDDTDDFDSDNDDDDDDHHHHHHHHHHDHTTTVTVTEDNKETTTTTTAKELSGLTTVTVATTIYVTGETTLTSTTPTTSAASSTSTTQDPKAANTGDDTEDEDRVPGLEPPMWKYSVTRPDGRRHVSVVMFPDDPAWQGPFGNATKDGRFIVYYALFQCMGDA